MVALDSIPRNITRVATGQVKAVAVKASDTSKLILPACLFMRCLSLRLLVVRIGGNTLGVLFALGFIMPLYGLSYSV